MKKTQKKKSVVAQPHKQRNKMRWWLAGGVLLLGLLAAGVGCRHIPVITVQGVPISEQEFTAAQLRNKASVISEFQREHGVEYDADFWDVTIDGYTAEERLNEAALSDVIQTVSTEQLLREAGLLPYQNYKQLQAQCEETNRTRAAAAAQGQTIYGPVAYGVDEYREYVISNTLIQLERQHYAELEDTLSDKELETFAAQHPEVQILRYPAVTLTLYKVSGQAGALPEQTAQQAQHLVEQLGQGKDELSEQTDGISGETRVFSEDTKHQDLLMCPELFYAVMDQPEPEKIVGPVEVHGVWYVGKVTEVEQVPDSVAENREWYLSKYCQYQIEKQIETDVQKACVRHFRKYPSCVA